MSEAKYKMGDEIQLDTSNGLRVKVVGIVQIGGKYTYGLVIEMNEDQIVEKEKA